MAAIILPHRWTRQPRGPVELDRGHPLAKGLAFAGIGGHPFEYATETPLIADGTHPELVARKAGPGGVGYWSNTATPQTAYLRPQKNLPNSTTRCSVFALVTFDPTATEDMWYSRMSTGDTGTGQWNFGAPATFNPKRLRFEICYASSSWSSVNGATSLTAGQLYAAAATYSHPTMTLYLNGRGENTASASGTGMLGGGSYVPTDTWLRHNSAVGSANYRASSLVHSTFIWPDRTLTEGEIAELSRAPWQLFRPYKRRTYSFATPVGAYIAPKRRTRPPQGPVEVNFRHPLARGLSYAIVNGVELIQDRPVNQLSRMAPSPYGSATQGNVPSTPKSDVEPCTLIAHMKFPAGADTTAYAEIYWGFWISTGDNKTFGFGFWPYGAGTMYFVGFNRRDGSSATNSGLGSFSGPMEGIYALAGNQFSATAARLYANGKYLVDVPLNGTTGHATDTRKYLKQIRETGAASPLSTFSSAFVYKFDRVLSDAEIAELSRNPWQILKPYTRRFYHTIGGSTAQPPSEPPPTQTGSVSAYRPRRRVTRPPTGRQFLDESNAITRGLIRCYDPVNQIELVKGQPPTYRGTLYRKPAANAIGRFNYSPYDRAEWPTLPMAGMGAWTGACVLSCPDWSAVNDSTIRSAVRNDMMLTVWQKDANAYRVAMFDPSLRTINYGYLNELYQFNGRPVLFAVRYDGSDYYLYVNGVQTNTVNITGRSLNTTTNPHCIGGTEGGGEASGEINVHYAAYWNRPLSVAEIRALSANPWQLFRPNARRMLYASTEAAANPWRPWWARFANRIIRARF